MLGLRLAAAFGAAILIGAADAPTEPVGYRMDDYRSTVPTTLQGAAVLSTDAARDHWERRDAVFIDVLPQVPRPTGLPASTIWRQKSREDVPGSVWLPDTGYGALAPVMERYFQHGLEQASGGMRVRAHASARLLCARICSMKPIRDSRRSNTVSKNILVFCNSRFFCPRKSQPSLARD